MKKIMPIILGLILVLVVIVPYSYSGNASKQFFTVSSEKVKPGETLEMTLNLNKIEYNEFEITLVANLNLEDIFENEEDIELEQKDGAIIIKINKEEVSLNSVKLYYTIPEDIEAQTDYTIVATVTNSENEEEQLVSTISVKVVENEKENSNKDEQNEGTQKENNNYSMNENASNDFEKKEQSIVKQIKDMIESVNKTNREENAKSKTEAISSKGTSTLLNNTSKNITQETVTYNGSDNNYLSDLYIEGYKLNKTFNKESSTYFIEVESSASNINVEATAEDSNATVCISGADNLKTGTNKVLISVTSESGAVRTYRIYVIKK